jgi:hypothetical protein
MELESSRKKMAVGTTFLIVKMKLSEIVGGMVVLDLSSLTRMAMSLITPELPTGHDTTARVVKRHGIAGSPARSCGLEKSIKLIQRV